MDSVKPNLSPGVAQMGSVPQNDPFLWDTGTLIKELCSQNYPWIKSPAAFAAKLANEEMDGHTLLTYDTLYSRKELLECLNITTARGRVGLGEAIGRFQIKSKAFRAWKKDWDIQIKTLSDDKQDDNTIRDAPEESYFDAAQTLNMHVVPSLNKSEDRDESLSKYNPRSQSLDSVILEPDGDYPMQLSNDDSHPTTEGDLANSTTPPPRQAADISTATQQDEERSSKRRRLAPTNLSTTLPADWGSLILHQPGSIHLVDAAKEPDSAHQATASQIRLEHAYLGDKGRHRNVVLSPIGPLAAPWIDFGDGGFTVVLSRHPKPAGQRLAVSRILRKHFVKNSKKEATLKRGFIPPRSPTPSDGGETVIDLDDLPDAWDEETQKEIDEEIAENAAREREIAARELELARCLPAERVESILKEELAAMETKWKEKKLPKYQCEAYRIWMDAKRDERSKKKLFDVQRDAEHYTRRIPKIYAEILVHSWQTEREVRNQASAMQQTLYNKLYTMWLVALLDQREPPPKPVGISRPRPPAAKTPLRPFEDELLTSSDEDDFIVPEDDDHEMVIVDQEPTQGAPPQSPPPLSHNGRGSLVPSEIDSAMIIDLTEVGSPEKLTDSKAAGQYIDLTSPIKHRAREASMSIKPESKPMPAIDVIEDVPPMDELGSLEIIRAQPPKFWQKRKDRWRLLLRLLWDLEQDHRGGVFRLVQENTPAEAWQASIQLHQTITLTQEAEVEKEETKTVAFNVTKLFLSFTQCRPYSDVRIMALDKKDLNKIKRTEPSFRVFHAFIKDSAPKFPHDSQIFRTDVIDAEIELEDEDDGPPNAADTQPKARKHKTREIVQNKEGVDLREREKKRVEEQEARRLKLRAALATSNTMTSDKSRLIINESKQDDQPFIYVNEEIGKRIKDHQIKGVRFLWNQIVLDASIRQGCLLAHTMGLGKTMQVITFLVAVREAASSDDESIRAQIPEDLRKSQSLILCPAGLVDNWLDEILLWAPEGLLGNLIKVESAQRGGNVRLSAIRDWQRDGGVLVIGYEMFQKLLVKGDDIRKILTQTPNVVICDEAHVMKNQKTKRHQVCQDFRTSSRIALTGSPLSNNVEEYYSMINWAAPNFLGPLEEFREIYRTPIEHGLDHDSGQAERRKALKMLELLKMNVAPKVQRATIECVRHELPAKYEFVIFVEPTPLQRQLYQLYLTEMAPTLLALGETTVFNVTFQLGLICNHPRCFRQKVEDIVRINSSKWKAKGAQQAGSSNKDDGADNEGGSEDSSMPLPNSLIATVLKETNGADKANPALSRKVELLLVVLDEARAIGDKVLVFSQSIPTLDYLEELFKQQGRAVCRLDGSTAVSKRQDMIKAFNTGRQEIYLISTKAGGVGLNIFGANRVVIFDFKWNPVTDQQAVGRAYRFGQTKTVYVYRFLIAGTFEEDLQNKAVFKMQLASRVVDKKNPVSWGKRIGSYFHPITTKPAKDLRPFANRDRILDKLIACAGDGGVIREIVSTDTFEEEDLANELTANELTDVKALHERLKHTDPQKIRQIRDEMDRADQIRAMAATARPPSMQTPLSSPAQSQKTKPAALIPGVAVQVASVPRGAAPNAANTPKTASASQAQPVAVAPMDTQVSKFEDIAIMRSNQLTHLHQRPRAWRPFHRRPHYPWLGPTHISGSLLRARWTTSPCNHPSGCRQDPVLCQVLSQHWDRRRPWAQRPPIHPSEARHCSASLEVRLRVNLRLSWLQ